jgi:predicted RNA-binding Zn-ribbon protein involved in translation (DUF1610 family)
MMSENNVSMACNNGVVVMMAHTAHACAACGALPVYALGAGAA